MHDAPLKFSTLPAMLTHRHYARRTTSSPGRKDATEDEIDEESKSRRHHHQPRRAAHATVLLFAAAILITKICSSIEMSPVLKQEDQERQEYIDAAALSISEGGRGHDDDNHKGDDSCNNILLYLEDTYALYGIGCQLNNYILAVIMAAYTNRSLVGFSNVKFTSFSTSQFGCPSGNVTADDARLPFGLNRIIKTPDWLSGGCSIPCLDSYNYTELWNISNNRSILDIPCNSTSLDGRTISVLPLDSDGLRNLAMRAVYYKSKEVTNISYTDLYQQLGATHSEIEMALGKRTIKLERQTPLGPASISIEPQRVADLSTMDTTECK